MYEYMKNKSLEDHLFGKNTPPLPWITRLKIMSDAAEGLEYLHEGIEVQVGFPLFCCFIVIMCLKFATFSSLMFSEFNKQLHLCYVVLKSISLN